MVISCAVINFEINGYTVPHNVTNAIPSNRRLFIKNADSRESIDSSARALLNRLNRQKNIAKGTTVPKAKNSRNTHPNEDAPKE
jgi:hypothetical protein